MPLYEYECDACGRRFELIRRFSDLPPESCSLCGSGPVRKLMSSPAIQFKGSGWYITDYAKKDQKGGGAKGDQKESGGASESAAAKDTAKDSTGQEKGGKDKPASTSEKAAPASKTDS